MLTMKFSRHNLVPALVAAAMLCALTGQASPRATKEQMSRHAADAEKYWDAPGTNYEALSSALIKPGAMPQDELLKRLNPMLEKAETAQDKAALNYLIGETYYWGGLSEIRKTRNAAAILGVGDKAVTSYLAAWDEVAQAGPGPAAAQLRQTISTRLNQLLATAACGSNLATNVKQQVVARYIDPLDKPGQAAVAWTPGQQGKVYANLGVLSRMVAAIPTTMPTNFTGVCAAMDLAVSAGATNDALRFASHLEETYAERMAHEPGWRRKIIAIYRACGDARADVSLKALIASTPLGWIDLYVDSVHRDPRLPQEQRREYMDAMIKALEGQKDDRRCHATYRAAVEALLAQGDHELAIWLADKAISDSRFNSSFTAEDALIWRAKAIAHQKRGERDKALEAYDKAAYAAQWLETQTLCGSIQKEADALRRQIEPKKERKDESDDSKQNR
jgi:hypothetical protein